jgi:hypothetical protein
VEINIETNLREIDCKVMHLHNWLRLDPVAGPFGNGVEPYGCVLFRTRVGFRGDCWLLRKTPAPCDNYITKFRRRKRRRSISNELF